MSKSRKNVLSTVIGIVVILAIVGFQRWNAEKSESSAPVEKSTAEVSVTQNTDYKSVANVEYAQVDAKCQEQIIQHVGYTVSYNPLWHIPNWVAYQLTAAEVSGEEERSNHFQPDPLVNGDAVVTSDYSHSGYDRGHMAPAADMKWSKQAMEESFYMTNMCPQNHSSNAGDWKDLEEFVRDLANQYDNIYIACGPIVTDTKQTIGTTRKIVVPTAFYKSLLRQKSDGTWTAIAFVLPNSAGNRPLMTYMHTVDEVEAQTGIDFFYNLPNDIENQVEADYNVSDWTLTR